MSLYLGPTKILAYLGGITLEVFGDTSEYDNGKPTCVLVWINVQELEHVP